MARGRSFFERLTGSVNIDEYDAFEEERNVPTRPQRENGRGVPETQEEDDAVGELTVDMYQTADSIVIKAIVAGVRPEDLDISITRDMVTIKGRREEAKEVQEENYFHRELYWGAFSRTILLPAEVDCEEAEAMERHGMLIIKLPKIDKARQTKLKVKSN
jgi:HSP20 family protein